MKRLAQILTLLIAVFFSLKICAQQPSNFEKTWKEVESLKKQGLPQSAIKLVDKAYEQAKTENNQPQLIKAALYKMSLLGDYEENHLEKAIQQLQNTLQTAKTPEKEILHSLLAELIQNYYNQNQWKILQRTTVLDPTSGDIQTWDAMQFEQAINKQYQLSLDNKHRLEALPLNDFQTILTDEKTNDNQLWPTLYDLLANRALLYFTESNGDFKQAPEPQFVANNPYFSQASVFTNLSIDTKLLGENHAQVLGLFQQLLAFHLDSKNTEALIDIDLRRLTYVYQQTTQNTISWNQYQQALQQLISSSKNLDAIQNVYYALAELHYNNGRNYDSKAGDSSRYQLVESAKICQKALNIYPDSVQRAPFVNLLNQIQQKNFSLSTEEVLLPGQSALARLEYKNVDKLYFKVVRLDFDAFLKSNVQERDQMERYLQNQAVLSYSQDVTDTKDHQLHSTLMSTPALDEGAYVLYLSDQADFNKQATVEFEMLWVSKLSYILKENENTGNGELYVLDRVTGKPLSGVDITVYQNQYNNRLRNHELVQVGQLQTDKLGYTSISAFKGERYGNYTFVFRKGDDVLSSTNYLRFYERVIINDPNVRTYLFTDRAIYRPGQTIYYKGIVVSSVDEKVSLVKKQSDLLQLYSPNGKKIMEIPVVTDDFGAFQGSFQIPQDNLNGAMNLRVKTGRTQVLVEEYKRPAFFVATDPIAGQYTLNDSILVTGKVENYAGNPVTQAQVSYRITRSGYWPAPYRNYHWIPPYMMEKAQIAYGDLTTNDQGIFSLKFKAIPDNSGNNSWNQFYHYSVEVQATDITGEVHDGQTSIQVGSVSALLDVVGENKVNKDALENFNLMATNLGGSGIKMDVTATYYQLKNPDKLLYSIPFGETDQETMSEQTYREKFPDLAWKSENEPDKMVRTELSKEKLSVDGKANLSLDKLRSWPVGEYALTIEGKDQYGKPVKAEHYFSLYSLTDKNLPALTPFWSAISAERAEPGETVKYSVASSNKKALILLEVTHGNQLLISKWISPNGKISTLDIPVLENHRGGLQISTLMVLNNRIFSDVQQVQVPFTNKKLDIVLETHRDFLTPGKKETWSIHIKGADGKALAAQLMAGMYDASLDQFADHSWNMSLYSSSARASRWEGKQFRMDNSNNLFAPTIPYLTGVYHTYPSINWFGYLNGYGGITFAKSGALRGSMVMSMVEDDVEIENDLEVVVPITMQEEESAVSPEINAPIPLRTNFNETAFFYPDLSTDSEGNVTFTFDTPDALTTWKLMMLAYTSDLKVGTSEQEFQAKKSLMVMPNVPRFVRQGDQLNFTAKVVNMTETNMKAKVSMAFFDPLTGNSLDLALNESSSKQDLSIDAGQGAAFSEMIQIPYDLQMLGIRITASDGTHMDGEERVIPVLTNKVLVTETMPMNVKAREEKTFEMINLVNTGRMMRPTTAQNFRFMVEFTSNPAWYAIQALPSIIETTTKSSLSVFNRYMANALSSYIVNSNPQIKQVFDSWKQPSPDALLSNLQKNEELKNAVLNASPWIMEAEDEATQKQRIALLFDLNQMSRDKEKAMTLLQETQLSSGAWPWFEGMRDDRYTTQSIVLGMAKLDNKGVLDLSSDAVRLKMIEKAVNWLDKEVVNDYNEIKKQYAKSLNNNHLTGNTIQYLYLRSLLLKDFPTPTTSKQAVDYFVGQTREYWLNQSNYLQGMLALTLPEFGYRNDAEAILRSLTERALVSSEMGMYWRQEAGWNWYDAPVETQAMLIEVYSKLQKNISLVDQLKVWLLKQKQTSKWRTSSATAEAVYALLMTGNSMLDENAQVEITVGGEMLDNTSTDGQAPEAGTGYFSKSWSQTEMNPEMGNIKVKNPNSHIAWGAAYWQYFEKMDKVIAQQTTLSVDKKLFIETTTDSGLVLMPVERNQVLKTGDKLVVRLIVKTDRNLEFVHLGDKRATGLEPVSNLSGYQYSGGLGYYHQMTDVGSDFFIRYLQKGTYILEYRLYVTQKGTFVDGIATIQSMYAPEFAAHSAGGKINVK